MQGAAIFPFLRGECPSRIETCSFHYTFYWHGSILSVHGVYLPPPGIHVCDKKKKFRVLVTSWWPGLISTMLTSEQTCYSLERQDYWGPCALLWKTVGEVTQPQSKTMNVCCCSGHLEANCSKSSLTMVTGRKQLPDKRPHSKRQKLWWWGLLKILHLP